MRPNTGLLLEQAAVSEQQARAAAAELGPCFTADRIERIKTLREEIAALAGEGFSAQDISRGRQLLAGLREADAKQEKAMKGLPAKTRNL